VGVKRMVRKRIWE